MSLLNAQDVTSFLIVEQKTLDRLKKAEQERARMGFREYIAQFGIRDLGELTESQMFSLGAARNISSVVDLLQIPSGKSSESAKGYEKYDLHREKTSLSQAVRSFLTMAPSDEQEIEVLRQPEEITQAIMEDQLLRRLAPREFLRRLTEGELLRTAWVQHETDENSPQSETRPDEATREGQKGLKEDTRPYGYILLDASESMGTGRDRRSEISRGIALAFLHSQFTAGNPTSLYLFRHELSPVIGGSTRQDFESAVTTILRHPYEGMTNLQGALKLLSEVLREEGSRIDIALITDGVTRLTEKPFEGVHLHTFLLGARPEEFDSFGNAQYQESLFKLRSWSDFMFRFNPEIMQTASVPRREDVLSMGRLFFDIEHEWEDAGTKEKLALIQRRMRNICAFILRYRESLDTPDPEVESLWRAAKEAESEYGKRSVEDEAFAHSLRWTALDRKLMHALETRESMSILDKQTAGTAWRLANDPIQYTNLFESLRLLFRRLMEVVFRRDYSGKPRP